MKKFAVLGMDVEEWYHLDYFLDKDCDTGESALDGLEIYLDLLKKYKIPATFFVVGEIVEQLKPALLKVLAEGHEIALHSYRHRRPLKMSVEEFRQDTLKSMQTIKDVLNYEVKGFRAPCFSLDRARLDVLRDLGLRYDASKINFTNHKLYGSLDVSDFVKVDEDVYRKEDFLEFETSTLNLFGKNIPVSGGGYLRILPWYLTRFLINRFLKTSRNYFFYIHPFEFSKNYVLQAPAGTSVLTRFRFQRGRRSVEKKMHRLIKILQTAGYEFATFEQLLKKYAQTP